MDQAFRAEGDSPSSADALFKVDRINLRFRKIKQVIVLVLSLIGSYVY